GVAVAPDIDDNSAAVAAHLQDGPARDGAAERYVDTSLQPGGDGVAAAVNNERNDEVRRVRGGNEGAGAGGEVRERGRARASEIGQLVGGAGQCGNRRKLGILSLYVDARHQP